MSLTNRKMHRWLSLLGIVFFLNVSATGIWLQGEALFGEDEAAREATASLVSPVSLAAPLTDQSHTLDKARLAVLARYGERPVTAIDWLIKAPTPAFIFHLDGSAPLKVTVDARTAAILDSEPDGEGWVMRLHTGEILGDGGKVLGLAWGLALLAMSITGTLVYLQMQRGRRASPKARGLKRLFW